MHLLLVLCGLMVVADAEPLCDPETQYVQVDQCCKKCGPGTSMSSLSTCEEPRCDDCKDGEYQDAYTTQNKCKLQPYCDINRNFVERVETSKKKRSTCMCKQGHKCSSEECIICVKHTKCGPGYGVQSKGNHTHDTVCRECLAGTFSNDTSEVEDCKKWTECGDVSHIKTEGTPTSDSICEQGPRSHVGVIIGAVIVGIVTLLALGFCICKCKGNSTDTKPVRQDCEELFLAGEKEPERRAQPVIAAPTTDEHSLMSEVQASQEECDKTPEEDDELTSTPCLTENGKFVTQEGGKDVVLSRQESQTASFMTSEQTSPPSLL